MQLKSPKLWQSGSLVPSPFLRIVSFCLLLFSSQIYFFLVNFCQISQSWHVLKPHLSGGIEQFVAFLISWFSETYFSQGFSNFTPFLIFSQSWPAWKIQKKPLSSCFHGLEKNNLLIFSSSEDTPTDAAFTILWQHSHCFYLVSNNYILAVVVAAHLYSI